MVVIAKRGSILMVVDEGADLDNPDTLCVLKNELTGRESPPMRVQRALKWGYWERIEED